MLDIRLCVTLKNMLKKELLSLNRSNYDQVAGHLAKMMVNLLRAEMYFIVYKYIYSHCINLY